MRNFYSWVSLKYNNTVSLLENSRCGDALASSVPCMIDHKYIQVTPAVSDYHRFYVIRYLSTRLQYSTAVELLQSCATPSISFNRLQINWPCYNPILASYVTHRWSIWVVGKPVKCWSRVYRKAEFQHHCTYDHSSSARPYATTVIHTVIPFYS